MGESRRPGKGTWTPLIWEQGLDASQKLMCVHSSVCAHTHLLIKWKALLLTFKCWQLIQMQTCNNWKYLRAKKMFMDYLWPTDCQSATQDKKGRLWQMKQMWRDRESSLQSLWAGGRCSWPALPMLSPKLQAGLCAHQHSFPSRCGLSEHPTADFWDSLQEAGLVFTQERLCRRQQWGRGAGTAESSVREMTVL